jgi:hypothetical protein
VLDHKRYRIGIGAGAARGKLSLVGHPRAAGLRRALGLVYAHCVPQRSPFTGKIRSIRDRKPRGPPPLSGALDFGLIVPREEPIVTRPNTFAPEFKARAIDLYRSSEGHTIADVARDQGIGTETFPSVGASGEAPVVSGMTG